MDIYDWRKKIDAMDEQIVRLISQRAEAAKAIAEASEGFVYAISRVGITGTQQQVAGDASELVARLRAFTQPRGIPIAVGFGISNAEHVRAVAEFADAAVIGSALVALIEITKPSQAPAAIGRFIAGLRA